MVGLQFVCMSKCYLVDFPEELDTDFDFLQVKLVTWSIKVLEAGVDYCFLGYLMIQNGNCYWKMSGGSIGGQSQRLIFL